MDTLRYIELFLLIILLILIYIFFKSIKKSDRLSKYTVEELSNTEINKNTFLKEIANILNKTILKNHSQKFNKYIPMYYPNIEDAMELYSTKIISSLLFLISGIIYMLFNSKLLSTSEIILTMVIGYFIPNIIFYIKYKLFRKKLENDFLKAIVTMNNAFKSGKNIYGAIDAVSEELDGVMANEFSRMSLELSFGLDIEIVFKRFSDRMNIKEINYLTSTLTILSKTGGNIVRVFDSIEKSLYNKKELKLELATLTAGSKIIIYTVSIVPVLFILFINLVNQDYFKPFFTTYIGFSLMVIVITIYLIYIFSIRKILKVGNDL